MEKKFIETYKKTLIDAIAKLDSDSLIEASELVSQCRQNGNRLFICGNGGSAGNASHLVNDLVYGARGKHNRGVNATSLTSNSSVITCLANDEGYSAIFSEQLKTFAKRGDLLIVLSGSGNSENIIKALEIAREMQMKTMAFLGYSGGKAKSLADLVIHFEVDDMQIAEDLQQIVGHIIMRILRDFDVSKTTIS